MTPVRRLLLAVLGAMTSAGGAVWLSTQRPWLGVAGSIQWVSNGVVTRQVSDVDRIEEPDLLDTYPAMTAFFEGQEQLSALLRADVVRVGTRGPDGRVIVRTVRPAARPWDSLPKTFWLQVLVGVIACVPGAWVWALRPADAAARAFAVTGLGVLCSAHAAAVYSSRELALPGALFRTLSAINHFGAPLFGVALCTLFLVHPRRLVGWRMIAGLSVVTWCWWLADVRQWALDVTWGIRVPLILLMISAIAIAAAQWRLAKGVPTDRALLRWYAASLLIGPGLFILALVVGAAVGDAVLPQSYGLAFFVPTYVGLAIGLRRTRLFALDAWALHLLFWALVASVFIGLDLAVLRYVGSSSARGLLFVALLGLLTLPVRQWVWTNILRRPTLDAERLVADSLAVAYASGATERAARWQDQLRDIFTPLSCAPVTESEREMMDVGDRAMLREEGAVLIVPAVANSPAMLLRHAGGGRRLFGPPDASLVDRLATLLRQAEESRRAFESGALRERERITRDLHDSVSSPLLAGLARSRHGNQSGGAPGVSGVIVQAQIERALGAMREVVRGTSSPALLAETLADVRFEAVERLRGGGLEVHWPISDPGGSSLSGPARDALVAFVRETVSNILRHADATTIMVTVAPMDDPILGGFVLQIDDDGRGLPAGQTAGGSGLPNLHARAATLGGRCEISGRPDARGTRVRLHVPGAA